MMVVVNQQDFQQIEPHAANTTPRRKRLSLAPNQAARREGKKEGVDAEATAKAVFGRVGKAYAEKCMLEDPAQLNRVEDGDQLKISYTGAFATAPVKKA